AQGHRGPPGRAARADPARRGPLLRPRRLPRDVDGHRHRRGRAVRGRRLRLLPGQGRADRGGRRPRGGAARRRAPRGRRGAVPGRAGGATARPGHRGGRPAGFRPHPDRRPGLGGVGPQPAGPGAGRAGVHRDPGAHGRGGPALAARRPDGRGRRPRGGGEGPVRAAAGLHRAAAADRGRTPRPVRRGAAGADRGSRHGL
ncbi:MAG: Transcriptional regulator, AcrR family, partial [uncultured Corynebacteriales bacterium]